MESAPGMPPTHRPEHRENCSAEAMPVNMMITGTKISVCKRPTFKPLNSRRRKEIPDSQRRQLNVKDVM